MVASPSALDNQKKVVNIKKISLYFEQLMSQPHFIFIYAWNRIVMASIITKELAWVSFLDAFDRFLA